MAASLLAVAERRKLFLGLCGHLVEAGIRVEQPTFGGEILGFRQTIDDAIERKRLAPEDCTLADGIVDRECRANRAPLTLVNLTGTSVIYGFDGRFEWHPVRPLTLRATIAWAWGEGDNPGDGGPARVPLSRVPPLNGTGEVLWQQEDGLNAGAAVRWATAQDRLSPGDVADARIPKGGTPGFVVFDARAGLRLPRRLLVALVFENLTDARYRAHGSGVYSPGRSLTVNLEWEP